MAHISTPAPSSLPLFVPRQAVQMEETETDFHHPVPGQPGRYIFTLPVFSIVRQTQSFTWVHWRTTVFTFLQRLLPHVTFADYTRFAIAFRNTVHRSSISELRNMAAQFALLLEDSRFHHYSIIASYDYEFTYALETLRHFNLYFSNDEISPDNRDDIILHYEEWNTWPIGQIRQGINALGLPFTQYLLDDNLRAVESLELEDEEDLFYGEDQTTELIARREELLHNIASDQIQREIAERELAGQNRDEDIYFADRHSEWPEESDFNLGI
jgi:hypothetical protein